jgi:membrane protein insertase Oxa1/YidC/SpoIIIJ
VYAWKKGALDWAPRKNQVVEPEAEEPTEKIPTRTDIKNAQMEMRKKLVTS